MITIKQKPKFIYIDTNIWETLKVKADKNGKKISQVIEEVLVEFLSAPYEIRLNQRRNLGDDETIHYDRRSIYISNETWEKLKTWSKSNRNASKSGLIQILIKKYTTESEGFTFAPIKNGFHLDLGNKKQ
jgi:macrodomain Ter protein organizer (MatP/YcbG family)